MEGVKLGVVLIFLDPPPPFPSVLSVSLPGRAGESDSISIPTRREEKRMGQVCLQHSDCVQQMLAGGKGGVSSQEVLSREDNRSR